jgi:MarR family transcriptional regulator for hemolysin
MDYVKQSTLFPIEVAFKTVARRAAAILLRSVGCNRRETWVLLCVDDTEMSQRQIGDILGMHANVLVKLLDGLEGRGFVRRERRQNDRREQVIKLTDRGQSALHTYLDQRPDALRSVFSPLTDEQIEAWRDMSLLILEEGQGAPQDDSDAT